MKKEKMIKQLEVNYPTHACWCGNYETCDCVSEPHDNDEWGELIPLKGSRVMSKEEIKKLNNIKLPF